MLGLVCYINILCDLSECYIDIVRIRETSGPLQDLENTLYNEIVPFHPHPLIAINTIFILCTIKFNFKLTMPDLVYYTTYLHPALST